MPSGYEHSSDYSGPEPGWSGCRAAIMLTVAVIAFALWATGAFGADLPAALRAPSHEITSWDQAKRAATQIYREREVTFYCGCSYEPRGTSGTIDHESCGYVAPSTSASRAGRMEWEHVVPAAALRGNHPVWRAGGRAACERDADCRAALFDPHNLVPSVGQVNAIRSNKPYRALNRSDHAFGDCTVKSTRQAFEPPTCLHGDVARVYLYMRSAYGMDLSSAEVAMFSNWAAADPVSPEEVERDRRIAGRVGLSNPLVREGASSSAGSCGWN